ncbi:MAG: DUF3772 domain-containing protein [Aeromonadales bacterium]|nr:DUF3772 domain-containing protein [Aeromonadales bacterium]
MNTLRWVIGLWVSFFWLPLFAQPLADIDTEHELTVMRAQQLLAEPSLELHVLVSLRQQLATVRDQAASRVQKGSLEAKTLEAKLASLGVPDSTASESQERSQRRNELLASLAQAQEPIVNAKATVQSTELLIREVDARVRSYQAQHLLTRFPSPLSPNSWPIAWQQLKEYIQQLTQEAHQDLAQQRAYRQQGAFSRGDWLLLAGLFVVGGWLMTRGQRRLVHRLESVVINSERQQERWLAAVLSNFAHLLLPLLGLGVWLLSLPLLGLPVPKLGAIGAIGQALPLVAFIMVMAHWLGHTLFAPTLSRKRMLPFNDAVAKQGVRLCQGLGGILAIFMLLKSMMQEHEFSAATISVVSLPLFIVISLLLWRLATLFLYKRTPLAHKPNEQEQESAHLLTGMAYLMRVSALVAPLLVVLGLVNLARYAVVPLLLTLAQLGFALFLYHLILAAIHAIGKPKRVESNTPSLLPVLVVLVLGCLLLPLLAITWGAQVTDITEVWYVLTNGIEIGEIRLSLDMVIVLVVVFGLGMLVTHWLQRLLRFTVLPRTRLDAGAKTAVVTGVGYGGLMLAALIAVSSAGLNLASLAVVAGALSVGIGFGLQTIVSNFVSGIILLIERPIKEGDWIEVSGYSGIVQKISVRSTRIQTFDRHDVIVPNSELIAGTVKNMTLSSKRGRLALPVGVAYGSDLEQVRSLLLAIGHEQQGVQKKPGPQVLMIDFGDNSLNLELRCILNNVGDIAAIKSELLFTIYQRFSEVGIEIPFPQQDIHIQDLDRLIERLPTPTAPPNNGAQPDGNNMA